MISCSRDLFGVPIAAVTMKQALALVDAAVESRRPLQIGVVNAAKLVNMRRNSALRTDVLSSNLILADGAAVVWASAVLGQRLPERVAGIDLMMGMLASGDGRRFRVYCLGATADVLQHALDRIRAEFPGVVISGAHHGYFTTSDEPAIVDDIKRARPDILLVAMTSPRKEEFLSRWSKDLDVPVCHGVGGSFDVLAGVVRRAPDRWQRMGLEWLYRVKQEPRRLWKRYLITNTMFIWMVVLAVLEHRWQRCRP